ncbi:hypothetical protein ACFFRR_001865 [Megaselia abdita]
MKKSLLIVVVPLVLVILPGLTSAAPNCNKTELIENDGNSTKPTASQQLNNIIREVQCTLEKTNWLTELEKEAKRLEENAKKIGIGFLNSVSSFVTALTEPAIANGTVIATAVEKGEDEEEEDEEEEAEVEATTLEITNEIE